MRRKLSILATAMIIIGLLLLFSPNFASGEEDNMMMKFILTVEGEIQTEDPWITGNTAFNEWAKPMYYIWLDYNGNSSDARYGNGVGPLAHEIRFDSGRLSLTVLDDENLFYGWYNESVSWTNKENNIRGSIVNSGKSLEVSFPLSLINSPSTLEISAMASPYTSGALDNTGSGDGSSDGWITIVNTSEVANYEDDDAYNETLVWPSGLSGSSRLPNFNITNLEVRLYLEEQKDGSSGIGIEIWLLLIVILVIVVVAIISLRKKK